MSGLLERTSVAAAPTSINYNGEDDRCAAPEQVGKMALFDQRPCKASSRWYGGDASGRYANVSCQLESERHVRRTNSRKGATRERRSNRQRDQ